MPDTFFIIMPLAAAIFGALLTTMGRLPGTCIGAMQHFVVGAICAVIALLTFPHAFFEGRVTAILIGTAAGCAASFLYEFLSAKVDPKFEIVLAAILKFSIYGLALRLVSVLDKGAAFGFLVAVAIDCLFTATDILRASRSRREATWRTIGSAALPVLSIAGFLLSRPLEMIDPDIGKGLVSFFMLLLLFLSFRSLIEDAFQRNDRPALCLLFVAGFAMIVFIEDLPVLHH